MRVNLHLKADALGRKVRTKKITDQDGEGLAFQFIPSEEEELVAMSRNDDPNGTDDALEQLYQDALDIYETAREEVLIPRKDGGEQKYAAVRFKQQIDKGREEGTMVPTVARIVRKPNEGLRPPRSGRSPRPHAREPGDRRGEALPPLLLGGDGPGLQGTDGGGPGSLDGGSREAGPRCPSLVAAQGCPTGRAGVWPKTVSVRSYACWS